MHIGVRDEYAPTFGRQNLTLWMGAFASGFVGHVVELPKHDGYMITIGSRKLRVTAPAPRTEANWQEVDATLEAAANELIDKIRLGQSTSS